MDPGSDTLLRDRYVESLRWPQASERRRRTMAQHCTGSAGQHGGHPAPLSGQPSMSDRVDTTMNLLKTAPAHPVPDRLLADSHPHQLVSSDHAMLALREVGDDLIQRN